MSRKIETRKKIKITCVKVIELKFFYLHLPMSLPSRNIILSNLILYILFKYYIFSRLLSWAGKSIEPYGVDYILQKLGFSHARTTIPKWLQRGTLDPLDKLLSLALLRLVAIVPHKSY